jgi:hypothetical protein
MVPVVTRVTAAACTIVVALSAISGRTSAHAAGGRGGDGCAGIGGGNATGIGAALGCGLPPPAAPTPQDNGSGIFGASTGPPLGSKCIATTLLPTSGGNGATPSNEYVVISPTVAGNPETGLTTSGTIHSPLPIGSPTGPQDVAVPSEAVKTAAQQNAAAAAEAQGIADEFNAYQQQQITDAQSAGAFDHPSATLSKLLSTQYSAFNFYVPLGPPLPGGLATSEDATTWSFLEPVYVNVGRVVHNQVGVGPVGVPVYGPKYCSQLQVVGTDPPYLQSQLTTTIATFTAQINRLADALWHSFRRGRIISEPANGSPTYVGLPTCVGLDTGLPTGSGTPNPFTISLPMTLRGVVGQLPVAVSGRVAVSIVADGVRWAFNDPSGDATVHGQDSADPARPVGTPTYDASTQSWPDANAKCTVYHQYRGLAASPGVEITASEHFHIAVSGVYSTGAAAPVTFGYAYEPADSPVSWSSGPYPVYQIEAVPYAPGT